MKHPKHPKRLRYSVEEAERIVAVLEERLHAEVPARFLDRIAVDGFGAWRFPVFQNGLVCLDDDLRLEWQGGALMPSERACLEKAQAELDELLHGASRVSEPSLYSPRSRLSTLAEGSRLAGALA